MTLICGRCHIALTPDLAELCWFCSRYLCGDCWDTFGHCGHAKADALNAQIRAHMEAP